MPCVACREVVVGAVHATVHATDDYVQWASSQCARTLPPPRVTCPGCPALAARPNPNWHNMRISGQDGRSQANRHRSRSGYLLLNDRPSVTS